MIGSWAGQSAGGVGRTWPRAGNMAELGPGGGGGGGGYEGGSEDSSFQVAVEVFAKLKVP